MAAVAGGGVSTLGRTCGAAKAPRIEVLAMGAEILSDFFFLKRFIKEDIGS